MTRVLGAAGGVVLAVGVLAHDGIAAGPAGHEAGTVVQACRVVPGRTLETFLPVMSGWERGDPATETDTQESVSRTTVDYDRDESTISVELMDSCRNPDVLAMMTESLEQLPPVTPGTVVRHVTVNGFPGYEEFTAEAGHGEVHVIVAERFMVKVTAAASDLPTLQNAARLIPMQKLAALK